MIRTDCVRNGRLLVENMDSVTKEIYDKWSERIHLKAGDIVFTREAPMGESAIIPDDGNSYFPGQRIVTIRSKGNVSTLFINYLIYANEFRREIRIRDSAATTVANFGIPSIKNYVAQLPCVKEQRKIGKYFNQLDNLITLHQRKLNQLKTLKKYFLQNMFPAKGEKVPRIRFKGFTGDWEQRKLSTLFEKFDDGDWIEAKNQSSAGFRLVQTGNVGVTEYIDKPDNKKWVSEDTFNKLHCEEIFPGDILISRLPEPAGRACIVPETGTRMITAVDCTIARTTAENSRDFLVQCLATPGYFKWVNTCLAGGTRQRISKSALANYEIMVPTIEEQTSIGVYFKTIDHLITFHQRKLDQLQTMKKFMLQNMFI